MTVAPVPASLRLISAMESLLASAQAMAEGKADGTRRTWALRQAERCLREVGGLRALEPDVQARVNDLGRQVRVLDAQSWREAQAELSRLRHGVAEEAARRGRGRRGRQADRRS